MTRVHHLSDRFADDHHLIHGEPVAAIGKTEAGFTKQIDGIGLLITSTIKSFDDKLNDLKSRLDRGDGHGTGLKDGWGYLVGAAGLVLAAVAYIGSRA